MHYKGEDSINTAMTILMLIGYILLDLITGFLVISAILYIQEILPPKKFFDKKTKKRMLLYGTIAWTILGLFFELFYKI